MVGSDKNCKVYVAIKYMNALQHLHIPKQDLKILRKPSQLKITEQMRQRMQCNFRKGCSSTCKTVKSSQNSVTHCGDQNNSDNDCVIIDAGALTTQCSTSAIQSSGLSATDLLFTRGNGEISPDSDFNVISPSNSQWNSNSNSNSNETNLINSNCNDFSANLQEDVCQLNYLECADENMLSELIQVTDQYVHKMQCATTIVPSNLQEGNELIKFSLRMKILGSSHHKWEQIMFSE